MEYAYDPAGNRIYKQETVGSTVNKTWYVRDAQGNVLGVYGNKNGDALTYWKEQHLYGSSRLGMWLPDINIVGGTSSTPWNSPGNRRYELANHLGNVLSTISDAAKVNFFPVVENVQDYYPFGMMQPGRTYDRVAGSSYRYGFNGKENDNEVKGGGNQQDYGLRIYDPRVGKFLSVDPLANKYPYYSTYHFAGNSPIKYIDMDGGEPIGNYKGWIITNGQESGVFMATDKTGAAFWVYPEAYIKQNGFLGSYVAHRYYFFDPVADHTSVEGWSKEPFLDEGKPNSLQSGLYGLSDHGDKLILGGLAAPFLFVAGCTMDC